MGHGKGYDISIEWLLEQLAKLVNRMILQQFDSLMTFQCLRILFLRGVFTSSHGCEVNNDISTRTIRTKVSTDNIRMLFDSLAAKLKSSLRALTRKTKETTNLTSNRMRTRLH